MSYTIANSAVADEFFTIAAAAITSATQPKVVGGAAQHVGTTTSLIDNIAPGISKTRVAGSKVIENTSSSGTRARTGDYATMTAGRYIMVRGGANTEFLAGNAFTGLRSATDVGLRRSILYRETIRGPLTATAIRNNQWVQFSGIWSTDPTDTGAGMGAVDGSNYGTTNDHATQPTATEPGELVYKGPAPAPVQTGYQPNYAW